MNATAFSDAIEQESALDGWEQRYTKIGSGVFRGSIVRLDLSGLSLIYEQSAGQLHVESCPPPGTCVIGLPARAGHSRINGQRMAQPLIYQGDGYCIDSLQDGQARSIMVLVETSLLPPFPAGAGGGLLLSEDGASSSALRDWLFGLIEWFRAQPRPVGPEVIERVSAEIVDRASQVLHDLMSAQMLIGLKPSHSYDLYRRVCAVVDSEGVDASSVASLSRRLAVPDFIIREAFKEVLGITPRLWLQQRRLAFAHRILKGAAGNGKTIAEIALDHGFNHYSRFSQYYRKTYGELPSRNRGGLRP